MELILSDDNMTKLDNAISECVNSLVRSDSEKAFRKEVSDMIKEELNISTADFNALVNERFDSRISDKVEKLENIVDINEQLLKHRKTKSTTVTQPADADEGEDSQD